MFHWLSGFSAFAPFWDFSVWSILRALVLAAVLLVARYGWSCKLCCANYKDGSAFIDQNMQCTRSLFVGFYYLLPGASFSFFQKKKKHRLLSSFFSLEQERINCNNLLYLLKEIKRYKPLMMSMYHIRANGNNARESVAIGYNNIRR